MNVQVSVGISESNCEKVPAKRKREREREREREGEYKFKYPLFHSIFSFERFNFTPLAALCFAKVKAVTDSRKKNKEKEKKQG